MCCVRCMSRMPCYLAISQIVKYQTCSNFYVMWCDIPSYVAASSAQIFIHEAGGKKKMTSFLNAKKETLSTPLPCLYIYLGLSNENPLQRHGSCHPSVCYFRVGNPWGRENSRLTEKFTFINLWIFWVVVCVRRATDNGRGMGGWARPNKPNRKCFIVHWIWVNSHITQTRWLRWLAFVRSPKWFVCTLF